jgi:hypothetical protein
VDGLSLICIAFIYLLIFVVALLLVSTFVIIASRNLDGERLPKPATTPIKIQESGKTFI